MRPRDKKRENKDKTETERKKKEKLEMEKMENKIRKDEIHKTKVSKMSIISLGPDIINWPQIPVVDHFVRALDPPSLHWLNFPCENFEPVGKKSPQT